MAQNRVAAVATAIRTSGRCCSDEMLRNRTAMTMSTMAAIKTDELLSFISVFRPRNRRENFRRESPSSGSDAIPLRCRFIWFLFCSVWYPLS